MGPGSRPRQVMLMRSVATTTRSANGKCRGLRPGARLHTALLEALSAGWICANGIRSGKFHFVSASKESMESPEQN